MADLETLLADTRYFLDQGSDPSAPNAGEPVIYTKSGQLYLRNNSAVVGPYLDETAHDVHDHTGVPGVGGGGGAAAVGMQAFAPPLGFNHSGNTNSAPAGVAYLHFIPVTAPMKIRALGIHVTGTNSGTVQWGLFDSSSDATAATKVAGGSGTAGSTGWVKLAADSAPVSLDPGLYVLIIHFPAVNSPTARFQSGSTTVGRSQSSYTWDDTPDLTTGWTDNPAIWLVALVGDLDGSNNQW